MRYRRVILRMYMAVGCAVVSSVAFLGIPVSKLFEGNVQNAVSVITASVFWAGLFLEQVLLLLVNRHRKQAPSPLAVKKRLEQSRVGLLRFVSNTEAAISDIALLAALLIMIAIVLFDVRNLWISITAVVLLLLTFQFHCIFNGKNYLYFKHIKDLNKLRRS